MSWFSKKQTKRQLVETAKEAEWKAPPGRRNQTLLKQVEHTKPRISIGGRVLFYLLLVIFFGVTIYVALFSPFMAIGAINVSGTKVLSSSEIEKQLGHQMEGKLFRFIPRDNFFIVSSSSLEQLIQNEYKRAKNVRVEKRFPNALSAEINEREALILWCDRNDCWVVDEDGVAYQHVESDDPMATQNELVKIYRSSDDQIQEGSRVTNGQVVNYALGVKKSFQHVAGVEIREDVEARVPMGRELVLSTVNDWKIMVSADLPLDDTIRKLKTVLEKEIGISKTAQLEYVDLRIENKVFYKMKQEEATQGDPIINNQETKIKQ